MSVIDLIVLIAFIAVAVAGAEAVRLMCRRQLTAVVVDKTPASAEVAGVGTIDVD